MGLGFSNMLKVIVVSVLRLLIKTTAQLLLLKRVTV